MAQQAKKRKTRHDKALADHRHVLYHLENITPVQVSPTNDKKSPSAVNNIPTAAAILNPSSFSYVVTDLRKTAFITIFIIFAQIILFFIINKK